MSRLACIRAIGFATACASTLLIVAAPADAVDAERGEALYVDFGCYACHGYNGTGRVPLSAESSGILSNEALFIRYLRLRADQNPVNPKNTMPNYSADTLDDDRARDIYAYLRNLDDNPPAIEDVPVFRELLEDARRGPGREPEDD